MGVSTTSKILDSSIPYQEEDAAKVERGQLSPFDKRCGMFCMIWLGINTVQVSKLILLREWKEKKTHMRRKISTEKIVFRIK